MIQSVLFFSLGFFSAGLLALVIAPAAWRRAVRLTRKRIEATVPLSLPEIQAEKDRMRAEHAMATRRLEMTVKQIREKETGQSIEIARQREEIRRLSEDRTERNRSFGDLETQAGQLRTDLREREDKLQRLSSKLSEADRALQERSEELDRVGRMYEDVALSSSSRQIELVARESEVEKLHGDVNALRKDSDRQIRETASENKSLRDAVKVERKKVADLEKRLERMAATVADREEKIDKRDKDIVRLREGARAKPVPVLPSVDAELAILREEKARLANEVDELREKLSASAAGTDAEVPGSADELPLSAERERLGSRLTTLTRENRKLRAEISRRNDAGEPSGGDGALRERISDLAAEVVTLTAALDGPGSPIHKALNGSTEGSAADGKPISLADRIRALQDAAASSPH